MHNVDFVQFQQDPIISVGLLIAKARDVCLDTHIATTKIKSPKLITREALDIRSLLTVVKNKHILFWFCKFTFDQGPG